MAIENKVNIFHSIFKDYMYSEAIRLVDESIIRLREEVEKDTIYGDVGSTSLAPERFYFLSYLLSRKELR